MLISTLTTKGQATIPAEVRKELDLHSGDKVAFTIKNHQVFIKKITPFDAKYHKVLSTQLSEWASEADEEGYHDL